MPHYSFGPKRIWIGKSCWTLAELIPPYPLVHLQLYSLNRQSFDSPRPLRLCCNAEHSRTSASSSWILLRVSAGIAGLITRTQRQGSWNNSAVDVCSMRCIHQILGPFVLAAQPFEVPNTKYNMNTILSCTTSASYPSCTTPRHSSSCIATIAALFVMSSCARR